MFATLKNPTKQMLNISFWKLHAVKVKKANKKKCKTFFWQKKCCLLAVSFMSTSSTSSNSFFNFETNFHSVFFFNFVFFQLVFFSFKKTTKNVYKSSVFRFVGASVSPRKREDVAVASPTRSCVLGANSLGENSRRWWRKCEEKKCMKRC